MSSLNHDATLELGDELVKRKMDMVYGGGNVGLMGLISQKVFEGSCSVLGVIPQALKPLEISGETIGEVRTVADMHERKAVMAREADAFIALPGGYGTMEELLEMITWSQLGIHKKPVTHDSFISIRFDTLNFRPMILWVILTAPVGLLNVDGYYDSFLSLFDNGVKDGFIRPTARNVVLSAPTAEELINKLEEFTPFNEHVAPHESWKMQQLGDYSRQ